MSESESAADTNLYSHTKVVAIFNFRDLKLHPHGHLSGKLAFIDLLYKMTFTVFRFTAVIQIPTWPQQV